MNYKDAWTELKERVGKAETDLLCIRNSGGASPTEKKRIDAKIEGLRIAKEYIREMECIGLSEDD